MRSIQILFLLSVSLPLLFSCNHHSDGASYIPNGSMIDILPLVSTASDDSSDKRFGPGDSVGIFVVPYASGNQVPGDIISSDYAVNVLHLFNGNTWVTEEGGKIPWPTDGRNIDLYGYYPYDPAIDASNLKNYSFSVGTDQRSDDLYYRSDFLWAKSANRSPTIQGVPLIFEHTLSKANLNLRSDLESVAAFLDQAEIFVLNTTTEAVIDLSDNGVTRAEGASAQEIAAHPLDVPATGYGFSAEAILVPQTVEAGTPFLRVILNDTRYTYAPAEDLDFTQGEAVTFYITITGLGLSVAVETISEWEITPDVSGEIGTPAPRILDLNRLDWNLSRVYAVYDDNVRIAQVAREYLFRSGTIDAQAIVVYPIDAEGSVDYSFGYVARLMNRNRNTLTNEYEPQTAPVHGGIVAFSPASNSIVSYTAGTDSLMNKVEIVSPGEIRPAADNALPFLDARPLLMDDVDGNEYPVVKIGMQFWTRENYKAEHYNDGSNMVHYYFNDDPANKNTFGGLYPWASVVDERGFAPPGWHVPSYDEITTLANYLMPDSGRKLKANILWYDLSYNDDVTGFRGLPAGRRTDAGVYNEYPYYGQFWLSTPEGTNSGWRIYLDYGNNVLHRTGLNMNYTQSIRFIRDE